MCLNSFFESRNVSLFVNRRDEEELLWRVSVLYDSLGEVLEVFPHGFDILCYFILLVNDSVVVLMFRSLSLWMIC